MEWVIGITGLLVFSGLVYVGIQLGRLVRVQEDIGKRF